jgi:hypothetical protein
MASSNHPIIQAEVNNSTLNFCGRDQFNYWADREGNDLHTTECTTNLPSQQVLQTVENWETG